MRFALPFFEHGRLELRDRRSLHLFVAALTLLSIVISLCFDIPNQLLFFVTWTVALRSWAITCAIASLVAIPVGHNIGKANMALYRASRTDPLTGLLNRRALLESSQGVPALVALMIVDLDRFKGINDTHGHLIGDRVLQAVAHQMTAYLGDLGPIGRLGGEEFAILARHGSDAALWARLDAFRDAVAATPVVTGGVAVTVTISAGIARRAPEQTFEELYAAADRALYVAKATGRNRITCAEDDRLPGDATQPLVRRARA